MNNRKRLKQTHTEFRKGKFCVVEYFSWYIRAQDWRRREGKNLQPHNKTTFRIPVKAAAYYMCNVQHFLLPFLSM